MDESDNAFQKLVFEALRACGPDPKAIEAYVAAQTKAMTPAERERIERDIRKVLSFRAPSHNERGPH